jgi:hypothetical protein
MALLWTDGISENFEIVKANTSNKERKEEEKRAFPFSFLLSVGCSLSCFLLFTSPLSFSPFLFLFSCETFQPEQE